MSVFFWDNELLCSLSTQHVSNKCKCIMFKFKMKSNINVVCTKEDRDVLQFTVLVPLSAHFTPALTIVCMC